MVSAFCAGRSTSQMFSLMAAWHSNLDFKKNIKIVSTDDYGSKASEQPF